MDSDTKKLPEKPEENKPSKTDSPSIPGVKSSGNSFLIILIIIIIVVIAGGAFAYMGFVNRSQENTAPVQQNYTKPVPIKSTPAATPTEEPLNSGDPKLDNAAKNIDNNLNSIDNALKNVDQGLNDKPIDLTQ